ncbi:hypothetical protein EVAR_80500_1 [Eumeta japonica]|uniref:Uncharacterized protein n=1 Tax=Eumeta variegata TaxID=151549 RepID=A0A4C1TNL8_EUMVA|nr:hypothetical protein EVAR_80500_1 [Eumeta japonica]
MTAASPPRCRSAIRSPPGRGFRENTRKASQRRCGTTCCLRLLTVCCLFGQQRRTVSYSVSSWKRDRARASLAPFDVAAPDRFSSTVTVCCTVPPHARRGLTLTHLLCTASGPPRHSRPAAPRR